MSLDDPDPFTELAEARDMLELGGLTAAEEEALRRRVENLIARYGEAPPPTHDLPTDRRALWRELAALNRQCDSGTLTGETLRETRLLRDRVGRRLGLP